MSRSRSGRSARERSIRSPANGATTATSCRSARPAERGRRRRSEPPSVRRVGHETFDLFREPAVVRSRVVAADGHAGNGPRDQARLGRNADLRDGPEPSEVTGLQDRLTARPGLSQRWIVDDDRDRAERPFDRCLELRIVRLHDGSAPQPRRRRDRGWRGRRRWVRAWRSLRRRRLGGFLKRMELDPERAQRASERSTRRTILANDARSARARSASSLTRRRNEARVSRRSDSGVSATTDADRGRPSSSEISPK